MALKNCLAKPFSCVNTLNDEAPSGYLLLMLGSQPSNPSSNIEAQAYAFGPFVLRSDELRLLRNGITVSVSPKVLETLLLLLERSDRVVSKGELMERVWPGVFVEEGNLTQNISQLRRVLGSDFPPPGAILTLPKRGYSFVAPVRRLENATPSTAEGAVGLGSSNRDTAYRQPAGSMLQDAEMDAAVIEAPKPVARLRSRRWPAFKIIAPVLAILLLFAVWIVRVRWRDQNVVYAAKPSIAVLEFKNLSGRAETAWLSTALTENLQADLASLSEHSLARVHRDVGCDLVVIGSYLVAGSRIRLNVSVENAVTGKLIGTYSHTEDQDQVLALIALTGIKLRRILRMPELAPDVTQQVSAAIEPNPDVLKLYNEGLAKIRIEDGEGARPLLEQAVDLNPKASLAHFALSQAWSLGGYDTRAAAEAEKAAKLSGQLSRENQLRIEAWYHEKATDWSKAVESYRALHLFFPDNKEYSFMLAAALTSAGRPKEALDQLKMIRSTDSQSTQVDPRLLLLESDAFGAESQWPEALLAAEQGAAVAKAKGALIIYERTLSNQAIYLARLGQTTKEVQVIGEAIKIAQQVGDRFGSITLLLRRSQSLRRGRDLATARNVAQQALTLSKQIGARQLTLNCLTTLGVIYRDDNDLLRSREVLEQGVALAQELGNQKVAALKLNLANAENNLGHPDKARALYIEALQSAQLFGDRGTQNIANGNLGIMEYGQGNLVEGLRRLQLAMEGNRAISQNSSVAYDLGHVATLLMMEGDFVGAHRALDEQKQLLPTLGVGRGPEEQRIPRARLAIEEGKLDEAEEPLQSEISACKDVGVCSAANQVLALLWLKRGNPARAKAYAEESYKLAGTLKNFGDYILPADLRLGEVEAALGQSVKAREVLSSTRKLARITKLLPLELEARLDLAEMQLRDSPTQARAEVQKIEAEATAHKLALLAGRATRLIAADKAP